MDGPPGALGSCWRDAAGSGHLELPGGGAVWTAPEAREAGVLPASFMPLTSQADSGLSLL